MRRILIALEASALMASFASAQTATTTEMFVTADPTDILSDGDNNSIGEIKDLIIADGQLTGYIVSVGGFLGMGEQYVVVSPASVQVNYSETDKKWSAKMMATKEQLKNAAEFKYEGPWSK